MSQPVDAQAVEIRQMCYEEFESLKRTLLQNPMAHNIQAMLGNPFTRWHEIFDDLETRFDACLGAIPDETLVMIIEQSPAVPRDATAMLTVNILKGLVNQTPTSDGPC
jgi:hypothetical protein